MKKLRKKKKYNLKSRITSALRRIWFYGPQRKEAAARAKASCNKCELCKKLYDKLECDHRIPVVPVTGFDNWQSYIDRLFCDSKDLVMLCKSCHFAKTTIQKTQRKTNKNIDKLRK